MEVQCRAVKSRAPDVHIRALQWIFWRCSKFVGGEVNFRAVKWFLVPCSEF